MADSALIEQIQSRMQTAEQDELYVAIENNIPSLQKDAVVQAAALKLPSPKEIGEAFYVRFLRPAVEEGICTRAGFCQHRKLYDTAAKLTGLVADQVTEAIGKMHGFPPGSGKAAAIIVETSAAILKEGLNKICDCKA